MGKLIPLDITEPRLKCKICAYELTHPESLLLGDVCIWHAESIEPIKNLSILAFLWLAFNELRLVRDKVRMKDRGLTEVDYQACIGEVAEDLHFIDNSKGLRKLVGYMRAHGRA
jgi:hypothetical protein